jgi:pimeloyl-ACP methyl ester carboxylesterase
VTLVGHSYGALVVGLAAPRLPQVHKLVVLGAPGMGVSRVSDLGGARVYSALAPQDWMGRVPQVRLLGFGHGTRPSSPGFGATPLPTGGVAGHDYYLGSGQRDARLGRGRGSQTLSLTPSILELWLAQMPCKAGIRPTTTPRSRGRKNRSGGDRHTGRAVPRRSGVEGVGCSTVLAGRRVGR